MSGMAKLEVVVATDCESEMAAANADSVDDEGDKSSHLACASSILSNRRSSSIGSVVSEPKGGSRGFGEF